MISGVITGFRFSLCSVHFAPRFEITGSRRFVPTRYSLRHGNYTASTSLRSWVFEGSTNLLDWTVLREHGNDSSLANPFVWASWTISQEKQVCPATMLVTETLFLLLWRQSPDANRAATALGQQLAAHKARGRLASGKAPNVTESTVFPCFPESIPSPSSCVFDMSGRENVTVAALVCSFF